MTDDSRTPGAGAQTTQPRASSRRRRLISLLLAPVLVLTGLAGALALPQAAQAAGTSQVLVDVTAVDASTGTPITDLSPGPWVGLVKKIGYRVDFSCVTSNCDNATVKFDPTALDPNYAYYRLLTQSGFTPPLSGGSVTGSATAGYTVSLGNLVAGQSGQFVLEYQTGVGCGDWNVVRDGERTFCPVANFPDGFTFTQTVRGNADTASGEQTSTSAPVRWSIPTPSPGVAYGVMVDPKGNRVSQGGVLSTDLPYKFTVNFGSGCVTARVTAYTVVDANGTICASGYTVTQKLPPGAELVAADGAPTVTGDVATGLVLTWNGPPWSSTAKNTSAIGWGATNGYETQTAGVPRVVTIQFPRANLAPSPDQTCGYEAHTGGPESTASVTYISMPGVPGEVRTVQAPPGTGYTVRCVDPFGKAVMDAKTSTFDGARRISPTLSPITVPAPGGENDKEWQVTVANQANVPGVAVVTDDTLDQADAHVYRIIAPSGSTIAWTATDGTTTQSGTSTTTADAPAGFWFATSTVTSPPLAGPNELPTGTFRTGFTVHYQYRVLGDAQPGGRRTNTASAVMTYPDYPQLAAIPLGPTSHTIEFEAPFTGGSIDKSAQDSDINGAPVSILDIPATGSGRGFWMVDAWNAGNTPAVPVIEDAHLDPKLPVYRIGLRLDKTGTAVPTSIPGWTGTIEYTLDNGVTGTARNDYQAPAGRYIVAAKITGDEIPGGRAWATSNDRSRFMVLFYFSITPDATPGSVHTNTATGHFEYPNYGLPSLDLGSDTTQVTLRGPRPVIDAVMGATSIAGGASQATTTSNVTFQTCGSTGSVPTDRAPFTPEYVFMAPVGWNITPGSASFAVGAVPAGVRFAYDTVTVSGVPRQVAVASWPAGTTWGRNMALPCMSVIARPTAAVSAGTVSVPRGFIGNTGDVQPTDIFNRQFTDTPDIDGDPATLRFSEAPAPGGVPVAAVAAMQVLKEICLPDAAQSDGCRWYADPNNRVGVPPNSTSIRYRISVVNTGNTNLSDVVAYDVLPYPGDTGTSAPTAGTPRGSTFTEQVASVSDLVGSPTVSYSTSVQPCRPEVDAAVPDCGNDWGSTASGAQAIRMTRPGTFAPGARISMQYTASVLDSPGDGAVGCNSLAVRATGLGTVSEPAPVCASIEETDLAVAAGTPQLQVGRPGVLPWTVVNNGGAASSQALVTVDIPQGLSAYPLQFEGWHCTAADADGAPQYGTAVGPSTLSCVPDSPLLLGVPQTLNVPVVPTVDSFTSTAHISGRLFDGNLANNDATMTAAVAPAAAGIGVAKSDGVTTARPGDVLTYTITVSNPLDFETLSGATLTDALPGRVSFVSASDGGTESGGVVTWNLPDLPGAGTVTRTVKVMVSSTIDTATLVNTATVTAPDPASPGTTLTGSATDTDTVRTSPAVTLVKGSTAPTYGKVDDTVTYTFSATNSGDVTVTNVAIRDPLSGLSALTYVWPGAAGVLAPGQTVTATATYTITQADLDATQVDNTATLNGRAPDGATVTAVASHEVTSTATPRIELVKTADGTVTTEGDRVTYTFVVTNTGPLTLDGVTVTDGLPGLSVIDFGDWPGAAGVLAPGQSVTATATYDARQTDVDAGKIVNTATATGQTLEGLDVSNEDGETVAIERTPGISIVKDAQYHADGIGRAGQDIDYDFTVTNTGNTTLTDVEITDPLVGLSPLSYVWPGTAGVLLPGQSVTATATYTITQTDVDGLNGVANTATVTSKAPDGSTPTDDDTARLDTPATAGIQLVKTAELAGGTPHAGDTVTYRFAATNLGVLTLTGVTVTDPMEGLSDLTFTWPGADGVLAPGETVHATATYVLTQADLDAGKVVNAASVAGEPPVGDPVASDDTVTLVLPADAQLEFEKTGTIGDGLWEAGMPVGYEFTLENTGNVTLADVAIDDQLEGLSQIAYEWPGEPGILAPGETATATATYALTEGDAAARTLTNTATASSDRAPSVEDSVTLEGPVPPTDPVQAVIDGISKLAQTGAQTGVLPVAGGAVLLGGILILITLIRRRRRNGARTAGSTPSGD
ncbi:DUF11 domain-containing protein [Agromyces endophyticus]|uniref:DUF7507 domain-containing protein n=1 Tax=Agromyces sp. H17E-10 TaxID=2932244 RepID=UPI001FD259F8|nr:LPXTG cell wall anchor domain-containing protein [Agromyces sp. H17E-10]UOQ90418.1 DUF11 domain-containing protein [Agromyces sp. H17E-10]